MIVRQMLQQKFNPKTRNVGFVTESPKTAVSWELNKLKKTQRRTLKRCPLSKKELQTEEKSSRRARSFKLSTHNVTSAMRVGRNQSATGTTLTKQLLFWRNTQTSYTKRDLLAAIRQKQDKATNKIWRKPLTASVRRAIGWINAWSRCKRSSSLAKYLRKPVLTTCLAKSLKRSCSRAR